jgi:hypothetical protein
MSKGGGGFRLLPPWIVREVVAKTGCIASEKTFANQDIGRLLTLFQTFHFSGHLGVFLLDYLFLFIGSVWVSTTASRSNYLLWVAFDPYCVTYP